MHVCLHTQTFTDMMQSQRNECKEGAERIFEDTMAENLTNLTPPPKKKISMSEKLNELQVR